MNKTCAIDTRLESYRTFFDHSWAKEVNSKVIQTTLDPIILHLMVSWKSAANTHVMPWLMAEQLKNFYAGLMVKEPMEPEKILLGLCSRLKSKTSIRLTSEVIEELRSLIRDTALEVSAQRKEIIGEFDPRVAWREFIEFPEFQLSVWGSQRLVYGALYYAYEDFVAECYRSVINDKRYRVQPGRFVNDLRKQFGTQIVDECWTHPVVNIARLVRSALVHNGGRLTHDLEKIAHGLTIDKGDLQIMAPDNRALFDNLKVRVSLLIDHLLTNRRA